MTARASVAFNWRILILLCLILIVGTGLRLYGLERQSLWNDELSSWDRSHLASVAQVVDEGARDDGHPPAYLVLLYFLGKYVRPTEGVLRLPSVVAGVLSILLMYLMGCRLYTAREGLIAAAFMAVLWCPIYFSQEARPYAFLILLSLLTTYFWLPFLPVLNLGLKPTAGTVIGYVVSAIACVYLHYFGLWLVGFQGLAALLLSWRSPRLRLILLLIYGMIAVSFLPWLPMMRVQLHQQVADPLKPPEFGIFADFARLLFNGLRRGIVVVLLLFLWPVVHAAYRAIRARDLARFKIEISPSGVLLMGWLLVPLVSAFLESRLFLPILQFRYLLVCLPPAYLLLARSITRLPLRRPYQAMIACGLAGLFLFGLLVNLDYYGRATKEQFREAVAYVVKNDPGPGNSLVLGAVRNLDYLDYYFGLLGSDRRSDLPALESADVPAISRLIEQRRPQYVWLVSAHAVPAPEIVTALRTRLALLREQEFIGARVWLFSNSP
jgi:mannosyltransferase